MKIKSIISAVLVVSILATMAIGLSGLGSAETLYSQTFEAENATLGANANPEKPNVVKMDATTSIKLGTMEYSIPSGFSGTGAVAMANNPPEALDVVAIYITVPSTGRFDITFTSTDIYKNDVRKNALYVNGEYWDYFYSGDEEWVDYTISGVYLKAGVNTIAVRKHTTCDGNIYLDKIKIQQTTVETDGDFYKVEPVLSNPNSSDTTKRLYSYLCDVYGKQTLTGQFSESGSAKEIVAIQNATGKTPAIVGFDLMNYTSTYAHYLPDNAQKLKTTQNIIDWVNTSGGIATVTWHWYAPYQYIKNDAWTSSFRSSSLYTRATADHPVYFSLKNIMGGKDEDGYNALIKDIDMMAAQLKILQDNGVSVLWRPLHEAAGSETASSWFWWGQDKDSYIQLWKLVYDRLTDYHGLNNLIWVWNGQNPDWYPGDNYCDIIGWDVYPKAFDYIASSNRFWQSTNYVDKHNKIVALTENGTMPSIDKMIENNAMWSWFCTWSGEYVINKTATFAENYTSLEQLNKLYNNDKTITLDELPSNLYTTYPIGATTYTLTKSASEKYKSPYSGSSDTDTDTDTEVGDRKYGDANNDGEIDITDVVILRAHIVRTRLISGSDLVYADVNKDGTIDIVDVVLIRKIIIG